MVALLVVAFAVPSPALAARSAQTAVRPVASHLGARVLADSVEDFSSTQGQGGWRYGYYVGTFTPSSFIEMSEFGPAPAGDAWFVDEGTYWTQLWDSGGHPNGAVTCCGRTAVEHWAVRRWVSSVAGDVTISGALAKHPGQTGGDGITGIIFVDGAEVYRQAIGASDTTGVTYSVDVAVRSGSIVDLAIAPGPSDGADSTTFTARITLLRLRLADSVADHSGVQGHDNWYYGYLSGSFASGTFDLLRQWVPGAFGDTRDVWFLDRTLYRTALWQDGGHPNTDGGVHWATRRWISPVAGQLRVTGRLAKGDTGGGDGVTGRVIVDGVVVFQQFIAGTDGVGVTYAVSPTVTVGSTVDLAIEADGTEGFDSTIFTAVISADADLGALHPETYGECAHCAFSPDPVNLGTGVFSASADDLALPGRVLGLAFARWYNSADTTPGPLGPAWTHSYDWRLRESGATVVLRRGDGRRETYLRNTDGTYASPHGVFDTLTKNADGTFTLTLISQVAYEFSSAGRLVRIHEPAGNEIIFSYTGSDLTQITDTVGRLVTFSHDGSGRLVEVADPLGRRMTYAYDSQGRLATVTDRLGNAPGEDPLAHQWKYTYDGTTQHLTTITDPDGRVRVTNTYDAFGRVSQQRDGLSALTIISYGTLTTTATDPRGHSTTYTFDSRMRVLSQTDTVGSSTYTVSYTYDAAGNRNSVTDREGNTTDLAYDARGNVLSKTDPSPDGIAPRPVTAFEYDTRNNLTKITDASGAVTTLAYDPATSALVTVTRQVNATTTATTSYEYADPANSGLPTRIYSPRGNAGGTPDPTFSTVLAYDAAGNLASRTDPDGATTTFQYDGAGRLTSFVDPDGNAPGGVPSLHTWSIEYDPNDREIRRTDPLGGRLEYGYDGSGDRTSLTDRNGNATLYTYDNNARLVVVQQKPDPAGPTTYLTIVDRDDNGNATRITQGNGVLTEYAFDALDRLTGVTTYPSPGAPLTTSYVLDGNGQPTSRTLGNGTTVTYAYDALARLTGVSGPSLSIAYQYDPVGRRTAMTDATGTTAYQYDDLGRVTSVASPAGALAYEYDLDGNRTKLAYPGGDAVTYSYSPGGRLGSVTDWAGRSSTYAYLPSGLVATLTQHGGLGAAYAYDRAQRLTSLEYSQQVAGVPVTVLRQEFALDTEGNRTQLVESGALGDPPAGATDTFTYEYDGLSRLLSADAVLFGGGTRSETFDYDAATNIQARTGPAATYTMDGANRVTSDGAQAFTWDGADRLVQRGADTFSYDALSRLVSATVAGAISAYAYDGDGLLASRTAAGATDSFVWDASVAPAPLLKAGTDRVVHGLGPLYLARADGSTIRLVRDALGSVRAELNDLGIVTKAFRYAAYGAISDRFPSGATPTLLGYTGELADSSGLTYLRARWYDPALGRFVSRDPFGGEPGQPASLNAFGYAAGRPTLLTDPLGLDPGSSDNDPGLGCQKFVLCHVLPVLSAEATEVAGVPVALFVPLRGPFGTQVLLFARGKAVSVATGKDSAKAPPPAPFTRDQDALVQIAKEVKRRGISPQEAATLRGWAKEYGLGFRGPESHPGRPFGALEHIHVGPVDHVRVTR